MKQISRLGVLVVACVTLSVRPARADGFLTGYGGFNFGGDSANCVSATSCEEHRANWGVAFGSTHGIFGFEEDIGYAPEFFGKSGTGDNAVLTVMSNLMLVVPAGPIQPYALVGLGLIRPHAKLDASSLDASQNTIGYDVGGGINIFLLHSLGLHGDLRHLHTLQDVTLGIFNNQPLDFWRASAGLTLRF
jgi:outer membrane protein with beta-barrel domain